MLVYGNFTVSTLHENLASEASFSDFQWSLFIKQESPGMQTFYAPDEHICTVSRNSVDADLMAGSVEKMCVGVAHGWSVNCDTDATFTLGDLEDCRRCLEDVRVYVNGISNQCAVRTGMPRPPAMPTEPVLSCSVAGVARWCFSLVQWMDSMYRDFTSMKGLIAFEQSSGKACTSSLAHRRSFKDKMYSTAVYRCVFL